MKKILAAAAITLSVSAAYAQTSARTNAIMYQRDGKLDKAKEEIDKASQHSKTQTDAKTWYYRGEIYEGHIGHPVYGKNAPDAPKVAFESYTKAIELDKPNGEWATKAKRRKEGLYGVALNNGVKAYNDKNYDEALKSYELAMQLQPEDTTAMLYAAYAADAKQDWATSKKYYNKVLSMNHHTLPIYRTLVYIAKNEDQSDAETMRVLEQARKHYPNDKDFMLEELSLYLKAGKGDEAIKKLEQAIALDPTNSNLYAVMGTIQDQKGNAEEAVKYYKKAVEVDPANFDAQYNMGVYYFNKGAEINNKVSKMDYATYQKQGKKLDAEAKKYFEQALPYFEKAHQLNEKDLATMESLQKIYVKMNRNKDAETIMNKMDAVQKK
ncbi:MAG: tetratricopeptide repeat protein [Hymenobacteraceae bacterium]|nr:tetratricopeptide repeat protein [Hymenobacteraceae bacterium]MDX5396915.1 tetratricopeptide repeat protein [Hymenobacteraceae bacterium]MDX5512989.1 tetratricopeptide repeat protein [Hymenobacteraceae bacterium]